MGDIADFLAARIYDDELQAAKMKQPHRQARARAEVRAKRGILLDYMTRKRRAEVDQYSPAPAVVVLQYLALPYRDHPDYMPAAWTPPEPGTVELWGRR